MPVVPGGNCVPDGSGPKLQVAAASVRPVQVAVSLQQVSVIVPGSQLLAAGACTIGFAALCVCTYIGAGPLGHWRLQ